MTFDIDRLASALPGTPRAQLQKWVDAWEARGEDEPNDFVSWLHHHEDMPERALRDVATGTPVLLDSRVVGHTLRVLGEIGRGAMGEVMLARDEGLHRTVVVKRLHARLATEPELVRRFVAEAQLTAQLDHPGIVPVHSVDAAPGEAPTYAMKLVRGETLRAWFNRARAAALAQTQSARQGAMLARPAPLAARLELFLQLCEPIAYAHSRGVIHRDLKPDNVMVGPFGEVFVMDWGVSRLIGSPDAEGLAREGTADGEGTQAGAAIGTPAYMSPEQARGENTTMDGRSDQFTLGLLLYELATLTRARASVQGGVRMLLAAAQGTVDPLQPIAEPMSRELRAVIQRATAADPDRRYADVPALARDVRRILRGEPVSAAPDTLVQRAGRWVGQRRERVAVGLVVTALVGLSLALLAVLGGLAVREWDRTAAEARAAELLAVTAEAAVHARDLDGALSHYEGLLRAIAGVAERALPGDATTPFFLVADYAAGAAGLGGNVGGNGGPPDLAPSGIYRASASFEHADLALAPGVDPTDPGTARRLRVLASLRDVLATALLNSVTGVRSSGDRALVLDQGTPVVWTYVATTEGILVGFPGVGRYPSDYDPREQSWYQEGAARVGPGWGRPYMDESGMGLLVSCSMPIRGSGGEPAGVVALDLTVRYLVDTWLAPTRGEGFLLDDTGSVIARSAPPDAPAGASGSVPSLPWPAASSAVALAPNGQLVVDDTLIAWSRLAHAWTYVLARPAGPADLGGGG